MENGYIKIYRQVAEHWTWAKKPFSEGQAWIDLLIMANYANQKRAYGSEIITFERGTVCRSQDYLSNRWGWSRKKTNGFLKRLENDKMVVINATRKGTTVTIENYGVYQGGGTTKEPQMHNRGTTEEQPRNINKKEKNIYIGDFEECWACYPRKVGKTEAMKKYIKAREDGVAKEEILNGVKAYAEYVKDKEKEYIKHGSTWFNQKGWEDEYETRPQRKYI